MFLKKNDVHTVILPARSSMTCSPLFLGGDKPPLRIFQLWVSTRQQLIVYTGNEWRSIEIDKNNMQDILILLVFVFILLFKDNISKALDLELLMSVDNQTFFFRRTLFRIVNRLDLHIWFRNNQSSSKYVAKFD